MRTRGDVALLIEAGLKLGGTAAWDDALRYAAMIDGSKDERAIGRTGLIMLLNDLAVVGSGRRHSSAPTEAMR